MDPAGPPGLWRSGIYGAGKRVYTLKGEKTGKWYNAYVGQGGGKVTPEEIHRALTQLDEMDSFQPLPVQPVLAIGDLSYITDGLVPTGVAGMVAGPKSEEGQILRHKGFPSGNEVIYLNSNERTRSLMKDIAADESNTMLMPSFRNGDIEYFVAHEYGHLRVRQGLDEVFDLVNFYAEQKMLDGGFKGLSDYGQFNPHEAHAESWAHYVRSGYISGGNSFVLKMSQAMDWNLKDHREEPEPLAAASGPDLDTRIPEVIMDDIENGPIVKYADDEPKPKRLSDVK
jgi:hypothetical protein